MRHTILLFIVSLLWGCADPLGAVRCANDTPDRELTCADIAAERERTSVPGEEIGQASCPSTIGTMEGKPVVEQYVCSDVCPEAGGIIIVFSDVDEEECEAMGYDVLTDPASGSYQGCAPSCPSES